MNTRKTPLSVNVAALVRAAEARGIPWTQINDERIIQLGQGRFQKRLIASFTSMTSVIGQKIAKNKKWSNQILGDLGLPVTDQRIVRSAWQAVRAAEGIGYPVVMKPLTGNMGRLVIIGITEDQGVEDAYEKLRRAGDIAIVENFVEGDDYRMLVVGGELIAVAKRVPGRVVGDGRRTIEELVAEINDDPRRGEVREHREFDYLKLDDQADFMLNKLGYTRKTVTAAGEVVYLRATANRTTGGTSVDVTDVVHPDNRKMALRAAAASGLDVVGIDFLTRDISRSYKEVGGAICELNAQPGLRAHHLPNEGKPRDAAGSIIDLLYPPGEPCRISTAVITGSQADTMTAHMLAHICKLAGHRVGMAINGEVYIDNPCRVDAGLSAPRAARMILSDCLIDAAVFQIAPDALSEHGLGFDACDVGAVQDMGERPDDTSGDSVRAMRIVLDGARDAVVLNADDEECCRMAREVQGKHIVYVTSRENNPLVDAHVAAGGCAVRAMLTGNARIVTLHDKGVAKTVAQLPAGASRPDGAAHPSMHSVTFAAAMAYAMGKTLDDIRCGVLTCEGGYLERLGGMRIYRGDGPTVLLDEVDSVASVEGLCRLASRLECAAPRVVIIYPPENARIEDINAVAAITAGCFDRYILTQTDSASASDDTMNQFKAALTASHVSTTSIELVRNDREAIDAALKFTTQQGQIVILTQNVERACRYLSYHDLRAQSGNENQRSLRRPIPLPRIKLRSPAIASSDRKAQK